MRRALHVAAFDSQLKWCGRLRDELERRGYRTEVVVPDVRSALSPRQIIDAGFLAVEHVSWDQLLDRAEGVDVVVCSLSGPFVRRLLLDLAERLDGQDRPGPVVVTGWVGVIIDRITGGFLDRCGSDVVAVNSRPDLDHFRRTARALALPTDNLLLAGLPFLGPQPAAPRATPVRRLLLADQPTVPSTAAERRHLYLGAVAYARAHPDREVLLKPRHRPEEDTLHRMRHHPEAVLAGVDLPPNFRIDHTSVVELLPTVDLLVTVSSTACLEALHQGCRVALLLDLGVHERFGNHVFLDSGLLRTWADITADRLGEVDPDWLSGYFFPRARTSTETVVDRVEELVASGERPSRAVWRTAYFQSSAAADRELAPQLEAERRRPAPRTALLRRRQQHGRVLGTVAHVSSGLVPPLLRPPLRSLARTARSARRRVGV